MDNGAAFIDGFNLYHGMNGCGLRAYLWVDLWEMCRLALPASVELAEVHYFTAPSKDPESNSRQGNFLSAQRELNPSMNIVKGQFRSDPKHCNGCDSATHQKWVEKRSDVNLAVEALMGAMADEAPRFQFALFVTADSDQVATIKALRSKGVSVVVAFPPGRYSDHLREVANGAFKLGRKHLVGAQMKPAITLTHANNHVVHRPEAWGVMPDEWPGVHDFDGDD